MTILEEILARASTEVALYYSPIPTDLVTAAALLADGHGHRWGAVLNGELLFGRKRISCEEIREWIEEIAPTPESPALNICYPARASGQPGRTTIEFKGETDVARVIWRVWTDSQSNIANIEIFIRPIEQGVGCIIITFVMAGTANGMFYIDGDSLEIQVSGHADLKARHWRAVMNCFGLDTGGHYTRWFKALRRAGCPPYILFYMVHTTANAWAKDKYYKQAILEALYPYRREFLEGIMKALALARHDTLVIHDDAPQGEYHSYLKADKSAPPLPNRPEYLMFSEASYEALEASLLRDEKNPSAI